MSTLRTVSSFDWPKTCGRDTPESTESPAVVFVAVLRKSRREDAGARGEDGFMGKKVS
jgi:hypothetical protein